VFPLKDNIPTEGFPVVTVALIALNVLAYFFFQHGTISLGDPSSQAYLTNLFDYGYFPYELTHPGQQCVPQGGQIACGTGVTGLPPTWVTVFTAMFMHGGLLHLGGNMLFLWIFGNNVEDAMGPVRFVIFYLLAGLAASGLQILFGPDSVTPNLGASGAIAGVLGGYLLLYPRAKVVTIVFIIFFFTILELPALLFLGIWFGQQLIFGALTTANTVAGGGVAYWAHVGGFAFGLLAIRLFATRRSSAAEGTPRFPLP